MNTSHGLVMVRNALISMSPLVFLIESFLLRPLTYLTQVEEIYRHLESNLS